MCTLITAAHIHACISNSPWYISGKTRPMVIFSMPDRVLLHQPTGCWCITSHAIMVLTLCSTLSLVVTNINHTADHFTTPRGNYCKHFKKCLHSSLLVQWTMIVLMPYSWTLTCTVMMVDLPMSHTTEAVIRYMGGSLPHHSYYSTLINKWP